MCIRGSLQKTLSNADAGVWLQKELLRRQCTWNKQDNTSKWLKDSFYWHLEDKAISPLVFLEHILSMKLRFLSLSCSLADQEVPSPSVHEATVNIVSTTPHWHMSLLHWYHLMIPLLPQLKLLHLNPKSKMLLMIPGWYLGDILLKGRIILPELLCEPKNDLARFKEFRLEVAPSSSKSSNPPSLDVHKSKFVRKLR